LAITPLVCFLLFDDDDDDDGDVSSGEKFIKIIMCFFLPVLVLVDPPLLFRLLMDNERLLKALLLQLIIIILLLKLFVVCFSVLFTEGEICVWCCVKSKILFFSKMREKSRFHPFYGGLFWRDFLFSLPQVSLSRFPQNSQVSWCVSLFCVHTHR